MPSAISGTTASVANTGGGSITLGGANLYGGNTVISSGSIVLGANASITNSQAIIVAAGAKLDASALAIGSLNLNGAPLVKQSIFGSGVVTGSVVMAGNSIISPATNGVIGSLSFSNNLTLNGGTLNFDITSSATLDQIIIGGTLALNSGSLAINVTGSPLPNGAYTLIKYPVGLLTGSVNNMTIAFSQAGSQADLDSSIPGQIRMIVSSATPNNLVWQGNIDANWDSTTFDWLNGLVSTNYSSHDNVSFNDTAVNYNVSLTGVLKPSLVLVTNSTDYTFTPSAAGNRLTGSASLVKDGVGQLTLLAPNDYSGPTTIKAGTIVLGDNSTYSGTLGSGLINNNSSVRIFNPDAQTIAGSISGSGSITNDGSGITALTGNNTYTGNTVINAGGLQIGIGSATGSLGTGSVTNNATLIFNRAGSLTVNNLITGSGTLVNNGSGTITLGAVNSYLNNTYVSNGVVKLGVAGAVPSAATVPGATGWLILDGGTTGGIFDLNGLNQTVNALSGNAGTVNGVITNSATTGTNMLTVGTPAAMTYNGTIVDNPTGAKNALTVLGTSSFRMNGNNTYTGGTFVGDTATLIFGAGGTIGGNGTLTLSNGTTFYMQNAGSTSAFPGNSVLIAPNSAATIGSSSAGNGFGGTVAGDATATNIITANVSFGTAAVKQFQGLNGTVQIASGGGLRFSSTGLNINGGDNATFEVTGGINTRNGTGAGAGISLGALTGTGSINGAGNSDGNGIYVIGAKNLNTVFSGSINGTVPRNTSIVKTGTGALTLDGTLAYDGSTTINNGALIIASVANPNTSLDASAIINLQSNAVLDVSARSDGTLNLGNSIPQTLSGFGTIKGNLNEVANSFISVGLGVLNVTNVATLNGSLTLQLNRTNAFNHSQITAASFTIGGPLTVTNVGPALQGGDTFQLFSTAVTGFTATNLPALTGSLYWTNNLAVNGSIKVVNPVNTSPPPIQTSFNGTVLTLSWPTNAGWTLQQQTNSLTVGLGTNWVDVPGSTSITSTNITIDPTKPTVFYRLKL